MLAREAAADSLQRILTLYPMSAEDYAAYTDVVLESCSWMQPHRFNLVCIELCRESGSTRRPLPKAFRTAYDRLDEREKWSATDKVARAPCSSCSGTGLVYIRLERVADGYEDDFSRPCPQCQPDHAYAHAPLRVGWCEAIKPPAVSGAQPLGADPAYSRAIEMAERLTSQAARWVIAEAERMGCRGDPKWAETLISRSAMTDELPEY